MFNNEVVKPKMHPPVSIIVPVYNTEKYLHKCLTSIVNQTLQDIEIILIDDGSTDSSGEICDFYAENDSRIKVVHQCNAGLSNVRNRGIAVSKGTYIGFVDSDDYIELDMYEKMLNAIFRHKAQIAICGRFIVSEDCMTKLFAHEHEVCYNTKEAIQGMLIYELTDVSTCDKLFCRSILDGVRFPSGYICEDILVVFDMVLNASRITHIGAPKYFNYQRKGSMSRSSYTAQTEGIFIYPEAVRERVLRVYPDLRGEADYFYLINFLNGISIVAKSSAKEKYHELRTKIRKLWFRMVTAKWFTNKERVLATLHSLNLYRLTRRVLKHL